MELKDILEVYQKCAEENDRLKRQIREFKDQETSLYESLKSMERDFSSVSGERAAMLNKHREMLSEIGTLQQQI